MGANSHIVLIAALYFGYQWGRPHYNNLVSRLATSKPEQIDRAKRFLQSLTPEQVAMVYTWLVHGLDSYGLFNSLGGHRFEVLRITIAPTLRHNMQLIDESLISRI